MKRWLLILIPPLLAACSTTKNLPDDEVLYTGVKAFHYDWPEEKKAPVSPGDSLPSIPDSTRAIVEAEVSAALGHAPNNAIFGSSSLRWPFPVGLWIYNRYVGSKSSFGRWMFSTFAATPVTLSTVNPTLHTQVARQALRANGFFQGYATSTIIPNPHNARKARLAYDIHPGPLYRLDSIAYERFDQQTDSIIRATMSQTFIHRGDPFSAAALDAERKRLSKRFRNNGFYYFKPEYISYRADTIQRPGYVQLRVQPSPDATPLSRNRYYIGRTTITVFPNNDFTVTDSTNNPTRTRTAPRHMPRLTAADSLRIGRNRDKFVMRWGGGEKSPLRMGAIRQQLLYEPGQLYRQGLHDFVQNQLSAMGIFSNIQMSYSPRDTLPGCDTLDVNIFAVLDKPYDSELEGKITNKSNGLLGPGLSWGLTKRNAFRGAESLTFKVFGSYEWQTGANNSNTDRSLLNSFELGASLSLTYPRLMPRFLQRLAFRAQRRSATDGRTPRRSFATTTFQVDVDWLNRASYFQMLSYSGSIVYTYRRNPWLRHELTPLRIEYNRHLMTTDRFFEIVLNNPTLIVGMEDHIVPSVGYTLTYSPRVRNGHSRVITLSAKEAGHVTNGIYALAGEGRKTRDKKLLGVPFSQFLRLTGEWRESWRVGFSSTIAARIFAGAVWSYGNSTIAPFADLLYVGGANSIRAFAVRSIGPGSYKPVSADWGYVLQLGNIKLETNVEWRFPIVGNLNGALFLDAGNVWLMQPGEYMEGASINAKTFFDEIAVGTGVGLRYDLDFLVLRFDVGVGIHAPYDTGRSGYYNMPRFGKSLGYHIAVGYPF